uniref:Uncharacterized protein n=1 Tax=Caenorhabditis japonica TaxID=281687 RepID=A0A8R1DT41_CAEJA
MTEIQLLGSSSLKVDYAITDKTYKVFERLQKKTEQIRDAMQDLERQCELVSLRVTRTASKILNKKSEKAVKQKSVMVLQEQLENDSTVNFNIVRFENWSNGMSPQIADDSNQVDCASGDKKIDEKEEEEENASIENISESSHEICNLVNDEDEEEQKIEDITPKILEDCSSSTNSSDVIPAKEESPPITNVLDKLPDNMKANLESIQRAQVSKVVDSKENTNKNKNGQIQV